MYAFVDGHINDNDDNSTDQNKDEGPSATEDGEDISNDSADSTDQQSEEVNLRKRLFYYNTPRPPPTPASPKP